MAKISLPLRILLVTMMIILMKDSDVQSLRLLEFHVPSHVPLGTRPILYCSWELGLKDILFSVKWYKNEIEFYRFVPQYREPLMKFPLPGVDIYTSNHDASMVTLTPAQLQTEGWYTCEVTGDTPFFRAVTDSSDMLIVVLPDHGPTISGSRIQYRLGDRVQVNCTSGKSKPATDLAWFINGQTVPYYIVGSPTYENFTDGLQTATLSLDFKMSQSLFRNGVLKLKCQAKIATVYRRSIEETVQQERVIDYPKVTSLAHRVQVTYTLGDMCTRCSLLVPLFALIRAYLMFL